jgi:rubrerythrin
VASSRGTWTEKNFAAAFCGESQARNRNTYFSKQARKEGYFRSLTSWQRPPTTKKSMSNGFSNCGDLRGGIESPGLCPACTYPQAHFEILGENW